MAYYNPEKTRRDYRNPNGVLNNKGGIPNVVESVRERISRFTPEIIDRLVNIVKSGKDSDAIKAADTLLDRCLGKAVATQDITRDHFPELTKEELVKETEELLHLVKATNE